MKIIILLLLGSCASDYAKYDAIDKYNFKLNDTERPLAPKMLGRFSEKKQQCYGQFLFFSNAYKENTQNLKSLLERTCPGEQYLLNATVTNTWWTTIVYSRSCISVEATCPELKVK